MPPPAAAFHSCHCSPSLAASSQISFEMQAAEAQIEPDFGSICERFRGETLDILGERAGMEYDLLQ
jgi:hypothetical protein